MARLGLICIASLVAITVAGPLQQPSGGYRREPQRKSDTLKPIGNCHEKDNVFQAGKTYEYKYYGKAETGLGFADSRTVGFAMECKVRLAVPQPCEYRMKVTDCQVFEQDGTSQFDEDQQGHRTLEDEVQRLEHREDMDKRGLKPSDRSQKLSQKVSKHVVQAQIADGEITKVVYHDEEEIWVLNFKKAILDALQVDIGLNSKPGAGEGITLVNGIHGLCPAKFSEKSTRDNVIIQKDLDSCIQAKKNNWELSPLSPMFNMSLLAKVMKAESVCSYQIDRSSHIRKMTCRETHHFLAVPWTKMAVATANVTQALRFVRQEPNAAEMDRSLSDKTITTILYEHGYATDVQRKDGQGDADEILKDLVKKAIDGFDIDAPTQFDKFINELRASSDLEDVIAATRDTRDDNEQEVAKHLLVQGLVQCNAPACLRALTTLMQNDEIPRAVFEPIVMALALTKNQDPMFLQEVKRICENRPTRTCILMVGALAYKMVEEDEDLLDDEETAKPIGEAARFLTDLIEDDKCEPSNTLDKAEEDFDWTKITVALKAIGNLGHVAQKVQEKGPHRNGAKIEDKIAKCITDDRTPDSVTVAAIQAFRRFVPTREISDHLLRVLMKPEESPHVKMAACMAAVRMATDKATVKQIVEAIKWQTSDQVKMFMVSHLRAVLKSEDPNYKKTAEHLQAVLKEKGQPLPKIKARMPHSMHLELSKFYEVPFLDDEENDFGVQIESMTMFSSKSYLPKSLQFNVSAQVFGDYINLVETGVDMDGVENLVEKVLGPKGAISKNKTLKKIQEMIRKFLHTMEEMGYKHFRFEDIKEFSRKVFELIQSNDPKYIVDKVLSVLQDVDTSALTELFAHIRKMDAQKIMETIQRSIPQSVQLSKTIEKLRRIRFQDANKETPIEILEAFGVKPEQAREIIAQAKEYGINVDKIVEWCRRMDVKQILNELESISTDGIQAKIQTVIQKIQEFLNWFTEKNNLPSYQSFLQMIKQATSEPSEMKKHVQSFWDSRDRTDRKKNTRKFETNNGDDNDDDDEEEDDEEEYDEKSRNDYSSLDQMPWGRQVKTFKRDQRDENKNGKDDDKEMDATAFLRIFGHEIGFLSMSDLTELVDWEKFQKKFNMRKLRETWDDIMDGFDVQPTVAAKWEGLHHIATGLGLPLQLTLNVTGIATVHLKLEPRANSLKQSQMELEPSAALQIAAGMTIDLPSIHSIAVVSNTNVKSEFEWKMRLDVQRDQIEIDIQKPDEELDIIHLRHEVKLVKDDEDCTPFDDAKTHEVKKQKCLPEEIERNTGLDICADLETSTLKGTPFLSCGPHELRISFKESQKTGLQRVKFAGKRTQKNQENRYDFSVQAPGHQSQREARGSLTHDRQRNHMAFRLESSQQTTPRVHMFIRNLAYGVQNELGYETGVNVELADDKHYNATVRVVAKAKAYQQRTIAETIKRAEFNYTIGAAVQAPLLAVDVSVTAAKEEGKIMMEHNLAYRISDQVRMPLLQKLRRFHGARDDRDDTTKFTLRYGLEDQSDDIAYDTRAFAQLLTFPRPNLAEPTIQHVSQVKIHRDLRHVGLHWNTTWLNENDEVEFFKSSHTTNMLDITAYREQRPVFIQWITKRNDWSVNIKQLLEKDRQANDFKSSTKITAEAMSPECHSVVDCVLKRAKSDGKQIMSIFKAKRVDHREPKEHRIRDRQTHHDGANYRERKFEAEVVHRFGESKTRKDGNGFWNERASREDQKVYEVQSDIRIRFDGQPDKEVKGITHFGSDARERDALVSLYFVQNLTAVNIPLRYDHFSHILINKEDGLTFTTTSSLDKEDRTFFDSSVLLQIDPKDMQAKVAVEVESPLLKGYIEAGARKAEPAGIELKLATKADSEYRFCEPLKHQLQYTTRITAGKMSQTLRLQHAKADADWKATFDLFGRSDSAEFDTADQEEDRDGDDWAQRGWEDSRTPEGAKANQRTRLALFSSPVSSKSSRAERQSEESRRRSPREIRERDQPTQTRGDETDDQDQQTEQRWAGQNELRRDSTDRTGRRSDRAPEDQRRVSKYENKWRKNTRQEGRAGFRDSQRDSGEDQDDREYGNTSKFKHTMDSLRKRFAGVKPTMTSILRVDSKDPEWIPSFTMQSKVTPLQCKIDVDIKKVPRVAEALIQAKRFTVLGDVKPEKATLKLMSDRGEAGAEIILRGDRQADVKVYDRDLTKSGETIHAEINLELPADDKIRAKFQINKESAPKIAEAIKEKTKDTLQVSSRLLKEKSEEAFRAIQQMYKDPRHPVYDFIRPLYKGTLEQLKNEIIDTIEEYREKSTRGVREMYEDDSVLGSSLKEFADRLEQEYRKWTRRVMDVLDQTPAAALIEAIPSPRQIKEELTKIANQNFNEQMTVIRKHERALTIQALTSLDGLRLIQNLVVDLVKSVDQVRAQELADKAMRSVRDLMLDYIKGVKEEARRNEAVRKLVENIDIQAIEEGVRRIDRMNWDGMSDTLWAFKVFVQSIAGRRWSSVMQKDGDKWILTVPHPLEWKSLKEYPRLTEDQRKTAGTYLDQSKRTFFDFFDDDNVRMPMIGRDDGYRFKWSAVKNLHRKNLPTQTAMIFGGRHIMTFDGKLYSMPQSDRQCTYLMARGTRNENFALVRSHDGVTLTLPDLAVTISDDNQVRLNNSRTVVQLPVESPNKKTTIKLVGDTVEVESETGITLKFNGEQKVCVVELSAGMWDESTGLLGTNDNEADNDWKMPTGKRADHAEEFVNAFELSRGAKCQLTKAGDRQDRDRRGDRQCKESTKCANYFRDDASELSTCFETVDPHQFMKLCNEETRQCNHTVTQEVVCDIVEAYRKICDISGVETASPEECDTCDGGRKERSKWTIRGNQRKVDVVVMVSEYNEEQTRNDPETAQEKIRALMETISQKLQQWNGQDVRAALVGFSGAGVHKDGHTHTLDAKQFDAIRKLPQALKTLRFKGKERTNVLEAIDFVVESHDFRPEATKLVLVFGPEERQFVNGDLHQSVQEKLIQRGITVTVFAKYDELKERDLGVNFDGTILSGKSRSEDTQGDVPSRRTSRLAKATRGAVFKLDSVFGGNDSGKKNQAAERTAETILEQTKREADLCKTCVCQQNEFNQLISSCEVSACA